MGLRLITQKSLLSILSFYSKNEVIYLHLQQTSERAHADKISELLSYIKTTGHYNGFVCTLLEDNQVDVVTGVLREDATSYFEKYNLKSKYF